MLSTRACYPPQICRNGRGKETKQLKTKITNSVDERLANVFVAWSTHYLPLSPFSPILPSLPLSPLSPVSPFGPLAPGNPCGP